MINFFLTTYLTSTKNQGRSGKEEIRNFFHDNILFLSIVIGLVCNTESVALYWLSSIVGFVKPCEVERIKIPYLPHAPTCFQAHG